MNGQIENIPRIMFDVNVGDRGHGYVLWYDRSIEDIEQIPKTDREGCRVILYMVGEYLEIKAILHFDEELQYWRGVPLGGGVELESSVPARDI